MILIGAKCSQLIHVVLVLFLLAASVAPACSGSANCSMPCCRHKAQPAAHPADAAPTKPCCLPAADASAGSGTGCRFVQHHLALPAAAEPGPLAAAAVIAAVSENPVRLLAAMPADQRIDLHPPDIPLFMRHQALLI